MNKNEKIDLLLAKLEVLMIKQQGFEAEIKALRNEILHLESAKPAKDSNHSTIIDVHSLPRNTPVGTPPPITQSKPNFGERFTRERIQKSDFEKFVGENLISKIGILILIIGVAIGAKFAIDKGMISATMRIVLGYCMAAALLGIAIKLKAKYKGFSAVLLSGAMAIFYFISYAAHSYYSLIPQTFTFILMVLFTCFTVLAAIKYNQQVIAHIGMVGAYAVPFLLSDGSGNIIVLLSYMAIINIGIMVLAFKKYWKSLFYSSFSLTWIIFLAWRLPLNEGQHYLKISLFFSALYFLTFYITNLAYKAIKAEIFGIADVTILLINSFIFFSSGYWILNQTIEGRPLTGAFTLLNAAIHLMVSLIIYKRKLADKNLFYFVLALVVTFITMAAPVQLDGNWVTIFWAVEAAILFYLGRWRNIAIYEKLSLALVFLAFCSLVQDWTINYYNEFFRYTATPLTIRPFVNASFLTGVIVITAFLGMFLASTKNTDRTSRPLKPNLIGEVLSYLVPFILILTIYLTFHIEISRIFHNTQETWAANSHSNPLMMGMVNDYKLLGAVCLYIYTLFFASTLTMLNLKMIKSSVLASTNVFINLAVTLLFLSHGLYTLSELRENHLSSVNIGFTSEISPSLARYLAILFFAGLIYACYLLSKSALFRSRYKIAFECMLYISVLWTLSSELLNILELNELKSGYKLGLSILWGIYSLCLIAIGLWKKRKHLRVGAIVLFGITLVKLFLYDISSLDTLSKTIVFVSLGILLLIISFLYAKYKDLLNDDHRDV